MEPLELLRINLLSPVILAFALGMVATVVRSDLKFPDELYTALSIYLLLAIGLKGGAALAETSPAEFWRPALATLALGLITPLVAYIVLRRLGRFGVADSAAVAAHYGSVSVVTFLASIAFLDALGEVYEAFLPTLVAVLEVPAIVVALGIARMRMPEPTTWGGLFHEVLTGRSVLLLLGGLAIGFLAGPPGLEQVGGFFVTPFHGALALFLLDLGMVTARRLRDLRRTGAFLLVFATVVPVAYGALGVWFGMLAGMTPGGATVLGVLAASASYIAAPAAVRISLPQANPTFYLTTALGITFPFNLTIGIPLYYFFARTLYGV